MQPKALVVYAKSNYGVNMSIKEAEAAYKAFFATYPEIQKWHVSTTLEYARRNYVKTLFGRVRIFEKSPSPGQIYNTPDQGTGGDIIKIALCRLNKRLPKNCKLMACIHDEVMIECNKEDSETVKNIVAKEMIAAANIVLQSKIKIELDINVLQSYGDK
jgi:DNA polymerase-1